MSTDDGPRRNLNLLPSFARPNPDPTRRPDLDPTPGPDLDPTRRPDLDPNPGPPPLHLYRGQDLGLSDDDVRTRTGTSSASERPTVDKPTLLEAAGLLAGLVTLLGAAAGWLVARRTHRRLRQPTPDQAAEIATPLARLGLRHVDPGLFSKDLVDVLSVGAATGVYLGAGPLLQGPAADPGLPAAGEPGGTP